ncbi:uncharacterized protein [Anabrus simplex]|uniref:uncharacterized protein n=1 Tax=Anabrus simplex TaxID=316456 RepID=UPI0034DD2536
MKEGLSWTIDDQGFMLEFADELADCGDLLRLEELGVGSDHIYELEDVPLVESDAHLLAGYTDCMDEAIRYLVEEEQYSVEHPVVQGLRQHLMSQQERILQEASRSHHNTTSAPVALLVETFCNIHPPSG